jgi:hypothetical protein
VTGDRFLDALERHRQLRRLIRAFEEQTASRRTWALFVLCHGPDVADSVRKGRPVPAHRLDAVALKRALRGGQLPSPNAWFRVRAGHLDAISEAGPLVRKHAR